MYQENPWLTSYAYTKPQHLHAAACQHLSMPQKLMWKISKRNLADVGMAEWRLADKHTNTETTFPAQHCYISHNHP